MSKKGINRRDALKAAGVGAGAGLLGGAAAGAPGIAEARLIDNVKLIRILGRGRKLDPQAGLSVVLLGTGTPIPNVDRACASTMVIAGGRTIVVDTGRFSSVRLAQAGILSPTMILYTHFHSDHITDFGEYMVSRFALAGADHPLPIIGPVGVKDMIENLTAAYGPDKKYRIEHHGSAVHEAGYEVDVKESAPGVVYDEDGLRITMFDVDHRPVVPAVGYKFEYKGQSVVVSGDTKKVPQMVEMSRDCDLLVHEAMNRRMVEMGPGATGGSDRMKKMSHDIQSYHTMTDEVAEIARDAKVKKLVLTHMVPSPMGRAMEAMFIQGMRKIYHGPIKVGRDLMEVKA